MRVLVNGRERSVDAGETLGALVDGAVPDRRGVAVALDGEVVHRAAWDTTVVPDGARLEIVGAVQGG